MLKDHGYNPTPVWTLIGGSLANRVPAGSSRGIWLLTLLDPAILLVTLSVVAWSFGIESALLATIYYCVCFGAEFAWTGGGFLRELSFSAILLGACALARDRPATGGACLALAAALRVFPAFLAAGAMSRAAADFWRTRRISGPATRLVFSFALTGVGLVVAADARFGFDAWSDFARNISAHAQSASANVIGLTTWLADFGSFDVSTPNGLADLIRWRERVYRAQQLTLFPLAALWVFVRGAGSELLQSLSYGPLLILAGFNLSAYYYKYLAVLLLVYRDRRIASIVLFGVEALVYALGLIEKQEVMLYLYKSLLLAGAFFLIQADDWRKPAI